MNEKQRGINENFKKEEPVFSREMLEKWSQGIKLPEDNEELFRNFDDYVPKDFKPYLLATTPPRMMDREAIKGLLEKDLYGSTLKEVGKYFDSRLSETEKRLGKNNASPEAIENHKEAIGLNNSLEAGYFEHPLEELEQQMLRRLEDEKAGVVERQDGQDDQIRAYISRLDAEVKDNRQQREVKQGDMLKFINEIRDKRQDTTKEEYDDILRDMEHGHYDTVLMEVEKEIGQIQYLIAGKKDKKYGFEEKNNEAVLKEMYGEKYKIRLGELRDYRAYLNRIIKEGKTETGQVVTKERPESKQERIENGDDETRLEGAEMHKQQIENNSFEKAEILKQSLIQHLDDLDNLHDLDKTAEDVLLELPSKFDKTLEDQGLNKSSGEQNFKDDKEKRILSPLLKLKQGLRGWENFSIDDREKFRNRVMKYLEDTFGVEEYKPRDGEKVNSEEQEIVMVKETDNKFLHDLVKRVNKSGFRMKKTAWSYYQENLRTAGGGSEKEMERIMRKAQVEKYEYDGK